MTTNVEHAQEAPRRSRNAFLARRTCGWEDDHGAPDPAGYMAAFKAHRQEVLTPAHNACRGCAVPIEWGEMFCTKRCAKASNGTKVGAKAPDVQVEGQRPLIESESTK